MEGTTTGGSGGPRSQSCSTPCRTASVEIKEYMKEHLKIRQDNYSRSSVFCLSGIQLILAGKPHYLQKQVPVQPTLKPVS
jgi:hypothetical protein